MVTLGTIRRGMVLALFAATGAGAQAGRVAMDEGVKFLNADEPEKAEKKFEEVLKLDPNFQLAKDALKAMK